ncbi:MAG: hypothetical protein JWM44_804, partial [Bacilli bacterium]|nr:hypothetical protein [Bacilli bacterium]
SYSNNELINTVFTIDPADPLPPTVVSTTRITVPIPDQTTVTTATYFAIAGTNLGINLDPNIPDISNAILTDHDITAATPTVGLTPAYVNGKSLIFKVNDLSELTSGVIYDLSFEKNNYTGGTSPTLSTVATKTVASAVYANTIVAPSYANEIVTNVSPLQVSQTDLASTNLTIDGAILSDASKVSVQWVNVSTGSFGTVAATKTGNSGLSTTGLVATVPMPQTLNAGTYLIKVSYNGNLLAQYPFTVANPALASINPPLIFSDQWASGSLLNVTGTGFGLDNQKLQLQFVSDATGLVTYQNALSVLAESQASFDLPSLPEGTYKVSMLYNGQVSGAALTYTVAPAQPSLQENSALSVRGEYKVFNFGVGLTIPNDRNQVVQFKFYNFVTDSLPPTIFNYHYVDPNLPYIDHTMVGSTQQLSEASTNTIGEMPNKLYVYANGNTAKVNLYIGDYTTSSAPFFTQTTYSTDPTDPTSTSRIFQFDLNSIPNGATKFTVIPSNDSTGTGTPTQGENLSGKVIYDINMASTPYIIINNLYSGMVIKDPFSEIACTTSSNQIIPGCISGRLINIPSFPEASWPTEANVEMYVNGIKTNLDPTDNTEFEIGTKNFHITIDTHGGPLINNSKNTIEFYIYIAGILQTKTSYDIFLFTSTAPEFQTIKPVETADIPKFVPGKLPDTYATSETAVSFKGQFLNASDFKLTVKQKDANGNQVSIYDRRVLNGAPDPANNNNPYLDTVDFSQSPMSFSTFPINLAITGDTIFEFTITNDSGVTITKTITITREPLPYVLIYPVLTKTSSGVDQANINSNYIEIEMAAENADRVNFGGKTDAIKKQVKDQNGNLVTHFFYELDNLKAGANNVKFTVVRGTVNTKGSFVLFNSNTTVEGAEFKSLLKTSLKVFNGNVELKFPAGTNLMRNDTKAINQYLTTDRKILFGIANQDDGRVDKYKEPSDQDGQTDNPNPVISPSGKLLLGDTNGRFIPASSLYWIDAGTIPSIVTDTADAFSGSGKLPYEDTNFFSRDVKDLVVPSKRGTLTLQYDPNIRSDAWKYITVYHFDIYEDYTGTVAYRWHNIGGVIDQKKNTITVPFDSFGYYQVMYMNQSFDDITSHPWARNQLDTLYSKGIMVNKENTDFVPNDNISRGEFAALLVKIFDFPLQYTPGSSSFSDVLIPNPLTNGLYDYRYIETAARVGIVRGGGGGRFSPDESITRQDAAVMISRAANLKLNTDSVKSLTNLQKAFTDANGIDLYARTAVEAVSKAGLITGKENVLLQGQKKTTFRFDGDQNFTRAEAAQVAISVLQQQKKIPK